MMLQLDADILSPVERTTINDVFLPGVSTTISSLINNSMSLLRFQPVKLYN